MSDKLLQAMREQGFETPEAAIEHLKSIQAAQETAQKGDRENFEKAVDDIVADQLEALMTKSAKMREADALQGDANDAEVKALSEDIWFMSHMLQKSPQDLDVDTIKAGYFAHRGETYSDASIKKALDTTDASAIVPTGLAGTFLRDVEKLSVVSSNLRILDMPTNPWEAPYQSSSITVYGVDESTADSAAAVGASDPAVAKITFTAKKIGARALWSRELDEDSAIAILPMIREDFLRVTADTWEKVFIFGDETTDNTNINIEGTVPTTTAGAKDPFLQCDGMVHWCRKVNTAQGSDVNAALDKAKFMAVRLLMGKYGDRVGDLFCLTNRELLYDMLQLAEVNTLEKYGSNATVLTGELAQYMGIPLLVSDGLPKTDATGYIDDTAGDNTKKSFLLVNKAVGAMIGRRGDLRIAVEPINRTDQYEAVVFSRYDIQFTYPKAMAYGYNIT